ncbi:hypothetical protein NX059_004732 [Plenodomus lindquistii]|nr:hypothetical protein NX059_004732 [Plenodomus lindquistii]
MELEVTGGNVDKTPTDPVELGGGNVTVDINIVVDDCGVIGDVEASPADAVEMCFAGSITVDTTLVIDNVRVFDDANIVNSPLANVEFAFSGRSSSHP